MQDYTERLDAINEALISKLERAVEELDSYIVKSSRKEKRLEYDEEGKKPLYEEIREEEELHTEKGIVDRAALKQLVSTLKELRGGDVSEGDCGVEVLLSCESEELSL